MKSEAMKEENMLLLQSSPFLTYNFRSFCRVCHHSEQMTAFISGQNVSIDMGMNAFHQLYISLMQNVTQHVNI